MTQRPEFSHRTRQHFWQHLKNHKDTPFNVVIVGGGIVGAGFLRELGLQGMPLCFLFEKNDFASATSSASSKLIHAGIRYLELVWINFKRLRWGKALENLRFVWDASRERKILGHIAPELVKPKPIYLVLGAEDNRSPFTVSLGIWLYYLMQLLQGQKFARPQFYLSAARIAERFHELDVNRVKAVFGFWDSETDDARLVIETLQAAHELGCYALNYVEVLHTHKEDDLHFVEIQNRQNSERITIRTKILINATGPFADEFRVRIDGEPGPKRYLDRVAGSHLDVYPKLSLDSFYITAGDGRLVFLLKRNEDGLEYTRIGTTERPLKDSEPSEGVTATLDEISYLKRAVAEYFPRAQVTNETIMRMDAGIRPLVAQGASPAFQKSREHLIIEREGVYHVLGVKLTDFRRVAHELLGQIPWSRLHLNVTDLARSEMIPLRSENAPEKTYAEDDIVEMMRRTMILHWKDYYERRRGLGPRVLGRLNPSALDREFDVMREVMNWTPEQARDERAQS